MKGLGETNLWRLISAVLACACVFLAAQLWIVDRRLHAAAGRVLHAFDACPLTRDDLEHS